MLLGISVRAFDQMTQSVKTQCKCGWHFPMAVQIENMEKGNFALCLFVLTLPGKFIYPVTVEFPTMLEPHTYTHSHTHVTQKHIHVYIHVCTHTCEQTLGCFLGGQAEYVVYRKQHFSKSLCGKEYGCRKTKMGSIYGLFSSYSLFYIFLSNILKLCL